MAEATDSKSVQCGFESHQCYLKETPMRTHEFRSTVSKHRCSHYRTLMEPNSRGATTVTFYYDPERAATFVWLTCTTADQRPLPVMEDRAYIRLEQDWYISLFTENAREVWDELVGKGWRMIANGVLATQTK